MTRAELTGWREGLNKVRLNHLLRQYGGLGLADAKEAVDRLLSGERVAVACADEKAARSFCEQATSVGATCGGFVQPPPSRGAAPTIEKPVHLAEFRFPDFDISWAGESPWRDVLCFGSEDGRLRFTTFEGATVQGPHRVVDSGEAINGAAFSENFIAVSTRGEVALWDLRRLGESDGRIAVYPGGAHNVVATRSGAFVASLGPQGLLRMIPQLDIFRAGRVVFPGTTANVYNLSNVGSVDQGDVLLCAAREDGLVRTVFSPSGDFDSTSLSSGPHLDIVDTCSIGSPAVPRAAAALGIDGSLHLFRDAFDPNYGRSFRFDWLEGIAYRILCLQGHIFLLTSQRLYVLPELAARFLGEQPINATTTVTTTVIARTLAAVDLYSAFDRWILILLPDRLEVLEIGQLAIDGTVGTLSLGATEDTPKSLTPLPRNPWEVRSEMPLEISIPPLVFLP